MAASNIRMVFIVGLLFVLRTDWCCLFREVIGLADEDDLFDLARHADFLVVHDASEHVFADFGDSGDGEGVFVVDGEFAFADDEGFPRHVAFAPPVAVHGFKAGFVAVYADFSGEDGEGDVGAGGGGVHFAVVAFPVHEFDDAGGAACGGFAAFDVFADAGEVDAALLL